MSGRSKPIGLGQKLVNLMAEFDWHLPPSDKFSYETQFTRLSNGNNEIGRKPHFLTLVNQMQQIIENSRLRDDEILYIWNLINIYNSSSINKTQFVYFMHIVNCKRRGRSLPDGLPLKIKQEFLSTESTEKAFVRPIDHSRSKGDSMTLEELEKELKRLNNEISMVSGSKIKDKSLDLKELNQLLQYKKDVISKLDQELVNVKKEFEKIQENNNDELMGLIGKLQVEKDDLDLYLEKIKDSF